MKLMGLARLPFLSLALLWALSTGTSIAYSQEVRLPPFRGTIFDFPDLMKESDPTAYQSIRFVETAERQMFDRRIDKFQAFPVFVFEVRYSDRRPLEVAVNREFETEAAALKQAEFYATTFGRLPLLVREEIDALHIQAGKKLFGGGRNVLIHTEQGEQYRKDGILEETLGHEAAHALDAKFAKAPEWLEAQAKDGMFISTYARDNPRREDIAESIIPYFAVKFRPERITKQQLQTITDSIPARIVYFDAMTPESFPK